MSADQDSKAPSARDDNNLKKEKEGRFCKILKRKVDMETAEKKVSNRSLEDWILASPGLKPDCVIRSCEVCVSSCKQFKKKVHPCVSQFRGSSIAEAKDSLCLDRPFNRHQEMLSCTSIGANTSLGGKSHKRVRFDLPHLVIFYSPEEHNPYYGSESEGSFYSSFCAEHSFDSSAEEPFIRLAVDVLPHVSVSSKI
ncbi:hypothetical protein VNO78_22498 [Psophocarpus tetragonolobus]|uniref:Uncharacterized protein n=1 Tax=Psophocarpus tetragonolobus TaxID=3891 RepID=A0AAN9S4Z2_PSOTE